MKEKCFMINTGEISMFNLNRSATSDERAPDELAIMKIVYIIFLYASTIRKEKGKFS